MAQPLTREFEFDITVDADGTELLGGWILDGPVFVEFEIENTGANNITGFVIQKRVHPNAAYFDYATDTELTASASGFQYISPSGSELNSIAAGVVVNYEIWIPTGAGVQLVPKSTDGTTATIRGTVTKGAIR